MDSSQDWVEKEFYQWGLGLGFAVDEGQMIKFQKYARWLLKWNESRNLTSIVDWQGIFIKHFYDSLSLLSVLITLQPLERVLDLGTGAGFPGIPMKIMMPELRLTLCDSLHKRIEFLQFVANELGFEDVTVVHARAEELALDKGHRETYSHLVSRAVAQLPTLVEWSFPFLEVNGHFLAMKGPSADDEWDRAKNAAKVLNAKLIKTVAYSLPEGMGDRVILDIQKLSPTPRRFPRRPGDALRNPL